MKEDDLLSTDPDFDRVLSEELEVRAPGVPLEDVPVELYEEAEEATRKILGRRRLGG